MVTAVLIGAGHRGEATYGAWALAHPERLRFVAVAEPDPARRERFARRHAIGRERAFADWQELLERSRLADAAIVATGDRLHAAPARAALARGYHVLLEKPIALSAPECVAVVEEAERRARILQVGHVLRYARFYERVRAIVASGAIGEPVSLDLREHVAAWHMVHSFVRGKFRNLDVAAPFLVAKCCHDLDLLVWLAGRPARRVASFGGLRHFGPEAAPRGAPARCDEGCPVQEQCPYDAVRFYLGPDEDLARVWPWSDLSTDPSRAARRAALARSLYGRCVYRCDNDVADHQVVALEFEAGVTATFGVHGFAAHEERTLRITGSKGELRGKLHAGSIEVTRIGAVEVHEERVAGSPLDHFGGDRELIRHFVDVVERDALGEVRASGRSALESHLIGFAAERARLTGSVVDLDAFRSEAVCAASN